MSRNYDHHWKKGLEKKGEPLGIPTAAQAFWAKERARIERKKRKKKAKLQTFKESLAAADAKRAQAAQASSSSVQSVPSPSPLAVIGEKLGEVRERLAESGTNLERLESMVAPVLERHGYGVGQFVPGSLTTKLLLSGNGDDARIVTRLITARTAHNRIAAKEKQLRAEYAREAAQSRAYSAPLPSNNRTSPLPPWSGPPRF